MSALEEKLGRDLKAALLAGDKTTVNTLRGLKNVILYQKVANKNKDQSLPDQTIVALLQKEARKRQESSDLYQMGGNRDKASEELAEKTIIEKYLPAQLDEAELRDIVDEVMRHIEGQRSAPMGAVITQVKQRTGGAADGALIAQIVKERLN